jgi:N4-gp56 family major capsid protein
MSGQIWSTNTLGGYMYSLNLSKELRYALQPLIRWRQFCDAKDASQQGKHKGDKFHWNVFSDVKTQGGTLAETQVMPETNFTISQGELTITEYGNSVPYTGKLNDLSEQPVKEIINKVLKNDAKKAFDLAAYNQFNLTPLVVTPTGGNSTNAVTLSTNGTTAIANNIALGKDHIKAIVDIMKERNIPGYEGDSYFCIGHPSTFRNFKNELETIHQYVESGQTKIMNGEIGRYEGVRFIEQTNIPKESTWGNNKSNFAFFFGEDTVAEAIAVPEEMRGKIPSDYGRSMGVAWYFLGGFGIIHTDPVQARVIRWGSLS